MLCMSIAKRLTFIVCFLLAIVSVFSGCADQVLNTDAPELLTSSQSRYTTVVVEKGEFAVDVSGNANVFYPVQQDLVCNEKNMTYREILVQRGEEVKKGQTLITMDLTYSNADYQEWKLQLQRAQEDLASGKAQKESAIAEAKLALEGLESYEKTLAELAVQKLELELEEYIFGEEQKIAQLQEKITDLQSAMANNVIKAPFDGIVEYVVDANKGDSVTTGRALVRLHSADAVLFRAGEVADKLYYNMAVTVNIGRGNSQQSFVGVVVGAPNVLPTSLNSNYAFIKLANSVTLEQFTNSVRYSGNSVLLRDVLILDANAVHNEDGKNYVNILTDETVEKRFVVVENNGSGMVWVMDGLKEGQKIIVD